MMPTATSSKPGIFGSGAYQAIFEEAVPGGRLLHLPGPCMHFVYIVFRTSAKLGHYMET